MHGSIMLCVPNVVYFRKASVTCICKVKVWNYEISMGRSRDTKRKKTEAGVRKITQADGSCLQICLAALCLIFQKTNTEWNRANRKIVKQWCVRRTQAISNVSQTKHTAALGMITTVFQGESRVPRNGKLGKDIELKLLLYSH